MWNSDYVRQDLPFTEFRSDCAFMWQLRENCAANYILSADYLMNDKSAELFSRLHEDGLFGAPVVLTKDGLVISRDRVDSTIEIMFIDEFFGLARRGTFSVLDIGAGYGRLAHRITQAFDNIQVICTDAIAESTFLCEYYLHYRSVSSRARTVPLNEIESYLNKTKIDLAVNIHSFSECSIKAVNWWLDLLRRQTIRFLLIVPNAGRHGGRRLESFDPHSQSSSLQMAVEAAGYQQIAYVPKYRDPAMQRYGGISPTVYHLFELREW